MYNLGNIFNFYRGRCPIMNVRITESLICLVIMLIASESVSQGLFPYGIDAHQLSFHSPHSKPSLSSLLFEKTEEKTEEDRNQFLTVELADFTQLTVCLSLVHTPSISISSLEQASDTQPPLFKRFCVFKI
jgi:hypothetical protein